MATTYFDNIQAKNVYTDTASIGTALIGDLTFDVSYLTDDVTVNGTLTVTDNLTVLSGTITQSGPGSNIFGSTTMQNVVCDNLTVNGTQTFTNLSIDGNLTLTGDLLQTGGGTSSFSSVQCDNNCTVFGVSTVGTITSNTINVANQLTATGISNLQTLNATDMYVSDTAELNVVQIGGTLTTSNNISVGGAITQTTGAAENVLSSTTINGSLAADSITTNSFSTQSLNVLGDLTVSSDLICSGTTTISGTVTATSASIPTLTVSQIPSNCSINAASIQTSLSATSATVGSLTLNGVGNLNLQGSSSIQQTGSSVNNLRDTTVNGLLQVQGGNLNVGNKIVFPDGTEQTTAAASSTLGAVTQIVLASDVNVTNVSTLFSSSLFGGVTGSGKYFKLTLNCFQQANTANNTTCAFIFKDSSDDFVYDTMPSNGFTSTAFTKFLYVNVNILKLFTIEAHVLSPSNYDYTVKAGSSLIIEEVGPVTVLA